MNPPARKGERLSTPSPDPTASFFEELASAGDIPLLHRICGTIQIDLDNHETTEHWYLSIDHGTVKTSHQRLAADAKMRAHRDLFNGIVQGTVNATAALLRGDLALEGDMGLAAALARLFPGPPGSGVIFLKQPKERAR
jgi:hypothetical protein